MKTRTLKTRLGNAVLLLCLFAASMASAHTGLKESTPAADATVKEPPAQISLVFTAPVRLIKLEVVAAGKAVPTGFEPASEAVASYVIDTPAMMTGNFTVNWAAIGADGHTVANSFSFVVDSAAGSAP